MPWTRSTGRTPPWADTSATVLIEIIVFFDLGSFCQNADERDGALRLFDGRGDLQMGEAEIIWFFRYGFVLPKWRGNRCLSPAPLPVFRAAVMPNVRQGVWDFA